MTNRASTADGSLRGRGRSGMVWTLTQKWGIRVASLLTFVVLTHQLSAADFGLAALASAVIGIVAVVGEGGFGTYVLQTPEATQRTLSTCFWTALGLAFVLAAGLAVAGLVLSSTGRPLGAILIALAPTLLLNALSSVQTAVLRRSLRFRELAVRSLIATAIACMASVALALAGAGVWALVAQTLVQSVVGVAVLWRVSGWRPGWEYQGEDLKTVVAFSVNVVLVNLVGALRNRGDEMAIGAFGGTAALGIYSVAKRLLLLVLDLVASTLSAVGTPLLVKVKHDRERLRSGFAELFRVMNFVVTVATFGLAAFSPAVIPIVFGQRWQRASDVATVLAIGGAVTAVSYFDRPVLYAVGATGTELRLTMTMAAGHLLVAVAFAPLGIMVTAVALTVRVAVMWPLRMRAIGRALDLRTTYLVKDAFVTWLAAGVCAAPLWVLTGSMPPAQGLLAACLAAPFALALFCSLLWLLRTETWPAALRALPQTRLPQRLRRTGHPLLGRSA
ncbi:MAG: lipopolysaccharide biosynthesis protein [Motilibacteraceae bacterium]